MSAWNLRDERHLECETGSMPMLSHVQSLWRDLTDANNGFEEPVTIVGTDRVRCAPPGWVGVVTLLGSSVVASPPNLVEHVKAALDGVPASVLVDSPQVQKLLGAKQVLGPAVLFYDETEPTENAEVDGSTNVFDERVQAVLRSASSTERHECGLDSDDAIIFVACDGDDPAAIAGWTRWPHQTAHIGVLAGSGHRQAGFARRAASQALAAASASRLLPQWRAALTNEASIGLARSLELTELGQQLSLELLD